MGPPSACSPPSFLEIEMISSQAGRGEGCVQVHTGSPQRRLLAPDSAQRGTGVKGIHIQEEAEGGREGERRELLLLREPGLAACGMKTC